MMLDSRYQRVAEDDPRRCQHFGNIGQCNMISVEGGNRCWIHGGNGQEAKIKRESLRNYRLTQVENQQRLNEFSTVKTLTQEIGLLRLLIEQRLQKCNTPDDYILHSSHIMQMTGTLQKLITACHNLDKDLNQLVDKTALFHLVDSIVAVVGDYISDSEALGEIGRRISDAVKQL